MKKNKKNRIKKIIALTSFFGVSLTNFSLAETKVTTDLFQKINEVDKSIDFVDSNGDLVNNPSINFGELNFDFESQVSTTTLGGEEEIIRIQNPTSIATWNVTIAAKNPGDLWMGKESGNEYDFNDSNGFLDGDDPDDVGGQMIISPSDSSSVKFNSIGNGCSDNDITLGENSSFKESEVDEISLVIAGENASPYCRWELSDIPVMQEIPAAQPGDEYSLELVLTII